MKVKFLALPVGDLQVQVGERVESNVRIWPVQAHARSRGLVGALYNVDDTFTTRFDPVTKRTLGSELLENMNDFHNKESISLSGDSALIHREFKGTVRERVETIVPGSRDLLSAVFALRDETLTRRADIHIPIFSGIKRWELVAEVAGQETIKTDAGTFDTLVIRCRTTFGGKYATNGDITVWFSNDERRIPVRMVAPFSIGQVEAELTAYQSGAVARN